MDNENSYEKNIKIFSDRSEFYNDDNNFEIFNEGVLTNEARIRHDIIIKKFEDGFLEKIILSLKNGHININAGKISNITKIALSSLVDKVTSEVGRALVGLTIMQLTIKSIQPKQSIRLHKGSNSRNSFSWKEGISMRSLDKKHITPILRKYDLLKMNADGFMMTRCLAENYPYTLLYKAKLRGPKKEWITIIEELEGKNTDAFESLKYLISLLINVADEFSKRAELLITNIHFKINNFSNRESVKDCISYHLEKTDYAARLFEISIHSLLQSVISLSPSSGYSLKPLSQMRSANKKHGNIGDVEILENDNIIEAWDAKYGKEYLREEIEEIYEKISNHDFIQKIGFVTNKKIEVINEISERMDDLSDSYSIDIKILSFDEWVDYIYTKFSIYPRISEETISKEWIISYSESIAQKRRDKAPIDEPCAEWVNLLIKQIA